MSGSKQTTKSNSTTNTNQTQTAAPPTWTMPGISAVSQQVLDAVNGLPSTHYSGPMVATMDPATQAAIQAAWTGTAGLAGDLTTQAMSMMPTLQGLATGSGLNWTTALPTTAINAAPLQDATAAIQASMDPVMRQLTTQILPGITNSALQSGAYSGSRAMGVVPTEAIRNATQTMQQTAATLGYQAYEDWAQRDLAAQQAAAALAQQNYALETNRQLQQAATQLQAMGMTPEMINSILHTSSSQGDLLNMAAQLGLQNQQAGINNAVAMDQYATQAPFMGLDTAAALLAQLSGGWGTTTNKGTSTTNATQTTQQQQALLPQLLQGAVGLGSMALGMPGGLGGLFGGGNAGSSMAAMPALTGASAMFPAMNAITAPAMAPVQLPQLQLPPGWPVG